MNIYILFDYTNENVKSYSETLNAIKNKENTIYTNCLNFFSFSYLQEGYEVIALKKDDSYIVVSELLNNNGKYTDKEIRLAHNVEKLLKTNSLKFAEKEIDCKL